MPLSVAAVRASRVIFDAWESFTGFHTPSNNEATMQADQRSDVGLFIGGTNLQYLTTVAGAPGATVQYEATIGRIVQTWPSPAAAAAYTAQAASIYNFPLFLRFALANSVPVTMLPPLWRYRADFVSRATVLGATEYLVGVGSDTPFGVGGVNPFAGWSHRSGTNGGRWLPRYRLASGGAIVDGPDSGIAPAAWHQTTILYTPGLTPRLEWLIDGNVKFSLIGDAQLPNPIAGAFKMYPGRNMGAGVGTTIQAIESRFIIDEV